MRRQAEAYEDGHRFQEAYDPNHCEILRKHSEALRAKLDANGIPTWEDVNLRVMALSEALRRDYNTHGEPDGLKELRSEIADAARPCGPRVNRPPGAGALPGRWRGARRSGVPRCRSGARRGGAEAT
jgi:hypothetical protein